MSVVLPASVSLPEAAGKMSRKEVARLLKAPHGLGVASEQAAMSLISAGPGFTAPKGVTPESLRALGKRSEDLLSLMNDLVVVMSKLSQARLLLDKESFDELRKLNEFVKVGEVQP